MGRNKARTTSSTPFDSARDELYNHILRCGVLEAQEAQQREWFDDTIEYMAERYPMLSDEEIRDLRKLGERYCQPVIRHPTEVGAET
ncbi:MAG: hypothetical protein ACE5PT_08585 [Gemmatimonadales bacterium]